MKKLNKAFTLVELLIVIAILSILGIGLLIALDPLEQTRRATDTTVQQSAIEIKDALNRYYASKLLFPWCDPATSTTGSCDYLVANGCVDDTPSNLGAAGTCAAYVLSQLIDTGELKSAPQTNITNALNLVTTALGQQFIVTFQPNSKAFDTNLTNLYVENTCATPGDATTCPASGNACYYCLR